MKVLLTTDTVGGAFTHAVDLIAGLRRRDSSVEVVLVTFGGPADDAQRARIRAAGAAGIHESGLALEWMEDPWHDQHAASRWLLELERAERPDVVHLGSFGHAAAGWRAPVAITAHSCVWSWWRAVHGTDPPLPWRRYHRWVRDGLRAADAVIAPTRAMLRALRAAYGPWPGRTLVIPNATSVAPLPAGVPKRPFALAAGRMWDAAKNLQALVAAGARLAPDSVRVAGDAGPHPPSRPPGMTWLGRLDAAELAAHRRAATAFLAPARYEPFGLAILEAARDRCALVLGDIGSLRELWDGVAAFVAPDDAEALAYWARRLLSSPEAAAALGARAQQRSLDLEPDAMAAAHLALYGELADSAEHRKAMREPEPREVVR